MPVRVLAAQPEPVQSVGGGKPNWKWPIVHMNNLKIYNSQNSKLKEV